MKSWQSSPDFSGRRRLSAARLSLRRSRDFFRFLSGLRSPSLPAPSDGDSLPDAPTAGLLRRRCRPNPLGDPPPFTP